jgi:glutathione S-transferase
MARTRCSDALPTVPVMVTERAGETFSMADGVAAPSLFCADWAHPIAGELSDLRAYRNRVLARPLFARAVDVARPCRQYFP